MAMLVSVILTIVTVYNGFNATDKLKVNLLKSLGCKLNTNIKILSFTS